MDIYKPFWGARCVICKGTLVYRKSERQTSHKAATCTCVEGAEEPSEPFDGLSNCNCGVSLGIRNDHESQCAGAYIQPPMRVPLKHCQPRRLYKIMSRNLVLGVFDGKTGFIGIREKFGHEYLFTEYHFDTGPPFGTVSGVTHTDIVLPPEIELCEASRSEEKNCLIQNEALFNWLMTKEHELLPDHRRQMAEWRERIKREDDEESD